MKHTFNSCSRPILHISCLSRAVPNFLDEPLPPPSYSKAGCSTASRDFSRGELEWDSILAATDGRGFGGGMESKEKKREKSEKSQKRTQKKYGIYTNALAFTPV